MWPATFRSSGMESPHLEINEYEKFVLRMNPPRVVIDNEASENATLVKVDCSNRHGILLEVIQILTDLDLIICKAYISSDCGWSMDVFHVTDLNGRKITDARTIDYIQQRVVNHQYPRTVGVQSAVEHTAIELTGADRPGLLSEIFALLSDLGCNVVAAELWTHNMRVASLIYVTDYVNLGPIQDPRRLAKIKESLCSVLKGDRDSKGARTDFVTGVTHTERRLHQMMFADRDYEIADDGKMHNSEQKITVENCNEKGYSVVNIECRDRPKLLFDTVCTLIDMEYVVFHATIDSVGQKAYQEYYIRHVDGCTLNSDAERCRVIQCLRAAIERRASEGLRLELCMGDRVGLLSDVTRIFREHGLSVKRADVNTRGDKAVDVFYVTDAAGNPADMKVIEAIKQEIGQTVLQVKGLARYPKVSHEAAARLRFSFGDLFGVPCQVLSNLGFIKSFT
eukprot:c23538_g1_i1 orf=448-1803(-)